MLHMLAPSPGGQVSGMADWARAWAGVGRRVRHPVDLPEGYHATTGDRAAQGWPAVASRAAPGRRAVGLRQVDGMPHGPVVVGTRWSGRSSIIRQDVH